MTFALSDKLMKRMGNEALAMIEENIRDGVDMDGNAYEYSTRPFYRPYNSSIKDALGDKAQVFTRKNGKLGMIVMGYQAYKQALHPESIGKFLTLSGKMLRNLNVITAADNTVTLGFTDPELAQRAYWLNVSGAGRGRKLWKFMGIQKKQQEELLQEIAPEIFDETRAFLQKLNFKDGTFPV